MARSRSLLTLLVLVAACEAPARPARETAAATPARPAAPAQAAPAPAAAPQFVDGERRLMGTVFVIRAIAPRERAEPAIEAAFAEIARLEQVLSEWIPESEVSRINAAAGRAPVHVSEDTWRVVETGLWVSRVSEGAFDLSWAALRGLYDFNAREPALPDAREVARRLPLIRWQDIRVDEAARTVRLERRGMAIGTGAIAKGYALDRASAILIAAGVTDFMIYGGGQVQVHGRRGDRPWRVGIQHPRENSLVASLEATDVSISTSGDYEHSFFDANGRRIHHILDPATGMPAARSISVTTVTPDGMHADALSTAVFVLGPEAGLDMLHSAEPETAAVIIGADCVLRTTPGMRERLRLEVQLEPGDVVPGCLGRP